jgi:hypothetical protein
MKRGELGHEAVHHRGAWMVTLKHKGTKDTKGTKKTQPFRTRRTPSRAKTYPRGWNCLWTERRYSRSTWV